MNSIYKLVKSLILILVISFAVFLLLNAMPGNALISYISTLPEGSPRPSQAQMAQMMETLGYNRPLLVRYWEWLINAMSLDFGNSLEYRRPVTEVASPLILHTVMLNALAMLWMLIISIPAGILAAKYKGQWFDRLITTSTLMTMSIPSFFIGIFLMRWLAVSIDWIPPTGMHDTIYLIKGYPNKATEYWDVFRHMLLPSFTLAITGMGMIIRLVRNSLVDVLERDYIRTARAKGIPPYRVYFHHAFRNALLPLISLIGILIPQLIIGDLFVEAVFVWPGIGLEFLYAVFRRDYQLLAFILILFSVTTILATTLADIAHQLADPRLKGVQNHG